MRRRRSNELREMRETPDRKAIRFSIEGFKRSADRMFREAGVRTLYYSSVVDVSREGNRVAGVVIASKGGLSVIRAGQVVDATGRADVASYGGAPFDLYNLIRLSEPNAAPIFELSGYNTLLADC